MGNCTGLIKKRNTRPYGRANIVKVNLSASYATGGDTVPPAILGIGNRLSALFLASSATNPTGHAVEVVPGATEYAASKLRVRDSATGVEITAAVDLSAQSIYVEAISSSYR